MAKATSNMDAIKKKLDRIYSALIVMGITLGGILGAVFALSIK